MELPQEILYKIMSFIDINTRLSLLKKIHNENSLRCLVTELSYSTDDDRLELFDFLKDCVEIIQPILINYCDINARYSSYYPLSMDYYEFRFSRAYISYFKEMIKTAISCYPVIYDKIKYKNKRNNILTSKNDAIYFYKKVLRVESHPLYNYIADDLSQEQVEKMMFTLILKLTRYNV